jgi:hypothetical protein
MPRCDVRERLQDKTMISRSGCLCGVVPIAKEDARCELQAAMDSEYTSI